MNNTISYKDYIGSVEFSEDDMIFYGKVLGIRSLISYEGDSVKSLTKDFRAAIDDYLDSCARRGVKPEMAYKGSFNVRISPALHKSLALYANMHNMSLNRCVENAIRQVVDVG